MHCTCSYSFVAALQMKEINQAPTRAQRVKMSVCSLQAICLYGGLQQPENGGGWRGQMNKILNKFKEVESLLLFLQYLLYYYSRHQYKYILHFMAKSIIFFDVNKSE